MTTNPEFNIKLVLTEYDPVTVFPSAFSFAEKWVSASLTPYRKAYGCGAAWYSGAGWYAGDGWYAGAGLSAAAKVTKTNVAINENILNLVCSILTDQQMMNIVKHFFNLYSSEATLHPVMLLVWLIYSYEYASPHQQEDVDSI